MLSFSVLTLFSGKVLYRDLLVHLWYVSYCFTSSTFNGC